MHSVPRVRIPNKLKSYAAAKRAILPGVGHRKHLYWLLGISVPIIVC